MGGETNGSASTSRQHAVLIFDPSPVRALDVELLVRRACGPDAVVLATSKAEDVPRLLAARSVDLALLDIAAAQADVVMLALLTTPPRLIAWMQTTNGPPPFGTCLVRPVIYGDIVSLIAKLD